MKFYETEKPELVIIKGNELRLYKESNRLSVSRSSWKDAEGVPQIGKTVSINLKANKGNEELIQLFLNTVEILRK